ncbi:MAG: hypothetical protein JSV58_02515 [Candidatus Bathyarchaeota archaeon]|nr:MAG: hypothetical protein JSV58_02515 [Candidatus Bathyarchaeota archaeon]
MPSISISNFLATIALIASSALLVTSYSFYTMTIRTIPEIQELQNILNQVAAKGGELLTFVSVTNSTIRLLHQLPSGIGNQQYWIQLRNDSSSTWIEGALGLPEAQETTYRIFLPKETAASGQYIGGYGLAILECRMNSSTPHLTLSSLGG